MDKFLETYNPPKLSQEEAGNLNRQIPANEIEAVIKKKKPQHTNALGQTGSQENFSKHLGKS